MKKLFNTPEMAITKFDVENIITTSIQSTQTYKNAENALITAITGNEGAGREAAQNIFAFKYE